MRAVFIEPDSMGTQIDRQRCREPLPTDKIVGRKFGAVAKIVWPGNTAAKIAALAGKNVRTGERWLAGEFEAPAIVIAALIVEITKLE